MHCEVSPHKFLSPLSPGSILAYFSKLSALLHKRLHDGIYLALRKPDGVDVLVAMDNRRRNRSAVPSLNGTRAVRGTVAMFGSGLSFRFSLSFWLSLSFRLSLSFGLS